MKFTCHPLAKLLQKRFALALIACVPLFCLLCIGPLISGTYFAIPIIAILLLLFVVALMMSGVGSLELTDGTLRYQTTFTIKRWAGEKQGKSVRATLTVAPLQKVELHQNALEKTYNVGRVTFYGNTRPIFAPEQDVLVEYAEKGYDVNDVKLPGKHTFSGVTDFENFRAEIYNQIKDAAILYNDRYEVK